MKRKFNNNLHKLIRIKKAIRKVYIESPHKKRGWLEKYGSLITTFILAGITLYYAIYTHNISLSNKEMVKLSKAQFEQSKKVDSILIINNQKLLEDNQKLVSASVKQVDVSKRSLEYAIMKDQINKEILAKPIIGLTTDKFGRVILQKDKSSTESYFNLSIQNIGDADIVNVSISIYTFVHLIDSSLSEYYGQFGIVRPNKLFFVSLPKDSVLIATFEMEIFELLNDSTLIETRKIEHNEKFYALFEKYPFNLNIQSTLGEIYYIRNSNAFESYVSLILLLSFNKKINYTETIDTTICLTSTEFYDYDYPKNFYVESIEKASKIRYNVQKERYFLMKTPIKVIK